MKYALIRRVCLNDGVTLGVCWYKTDPQIVDANNQQNDGRLIDYLLDNANWRGHVDNELFEILQNRLVVEGVVNHEARTIEAIENARVFPDGSAFFSEEVPQDQGARGDWHNQALNTLEDANVIFLDPDNSPSAQHIHYVRGGKWAAPLEVLDHVQRTHTVICISHPGRIMRHVHHQNIRDMFQEYQGLLCSLYFGNCGFHCFINPQHQAIQATLHQFVQDGIDDGNWRTCRYFDTNNAILNGY